MFYQPLDQTGIVPCAAAPCDATPRPSTDAGVVSESASGMAAVNQAPRAVNSREVTSIGPYRVLRKLGEGGMGAVYLGEHEAGGPQVAIKVLSRDAAPDESSFRRFQKEARLLADVKHPNVTNLLDLGTSDGASYIVMEYVAGLDVKQLLAAAGAMTERFALQIVREVAAALEAAHSRNIVHRDIKPANVLIEVPERLRSASREEMAKGVTSAAENGELPVVKLSDFGLARHTDQSASMNLTQTGAMLGTPYYIAPEQCADKGEVTPAADVYSLGAMLFELLANRPPFKATDVVKLISLHCFEDAPDIRKLVASVSDGTARLIATTLQKSPDARFPDAGWLRAEIERLLRGETATVSLHPRTPEQTAGIIETTWEWDLEGSVEDLWPLVSNTDRVNSAIGLPAVQYRTDRDEHGAIRKYGEFKLGFAKLVWQEFPFEWIEGKRLGVLREFTTGPFKWFLSLVELEPNGLGGTRLKHTVRIAPKNILGRLLAFLEVNVKGSKSLDKVYRRMDAVVCGKLKGSQPVDPFIAPTTLSKSTVRKFESRQAELEAGEVDHECADALIRFLQDSAAADLARIRPYELAKRLNLPALRMVETCLRACQVGLLELHWDILCPTCRISSSVKDTLAAIDKHAYCEACDLDFVLDFGSAVELVFRVHPELRQADLRTYCLGGPEHAPHVVAQTRLEANEVLELDLHLAVGGYQLRGPQLPYTVPLRTDVSQGAAQANIVLGAEVATRKPISLRAGRRVLSLENRHDHPLLIRIERTISRTDVLTATEAGKSPLFRRLFPNEVVSRDQLSDFSACTLLAAKVADMNDVYDRWGDSEGTRRIREHMTQIEQLVAAADGQIVKQQDGQILAAFRVIEPAIETVAAILNSSNSAVSDDGHIPLRMALHRGTAMSTSINGRVDYSGRVVAQATALLDDQAGGSLTLSRELLADVDVLHLLAERGLSFKNQVAEASIPQRRGEFAERMMT